MKLEGHEPVVTINGSTLTEEQARVMRVAVESFAAMLAEDGGLGAGDFARALTERYRTNLAQVQILMYE